MGKTMKGRFFVDWCIIATGNDFIHPKSCKGTTFVDFRRSPAVKPVTTLTPTVNDSELL